MRRVSRTRGSVDEERRCAHPSEESRTDRAANSAQPLPYGLSEREFGVLKLLAQGMSDKQIAASLCVTTHTVNKHVGAILLKMNVQSRTAAAVRAIRERLIAMAVLGAIVAERGGGMPPHV